MPYVVTTRPPAAAASSSSRAGAPAPPSRIVPSEPRSAPASISRRSWVGTMDTCAPPQDATIPGSSRAAVTGAVPVTSDRTSTWIPATWLTGRQHNQRSPGAASIRSRLARAEASSAAALSSTPFGRPVDPDVTITTAVSPSTGGPAPPARPPEPPARPRGASPSGVRTASGFSSASSRSNWGRGSAGSTGATAGPVPSSAASSGPSSPSGPARTACRRRSLTVVRLGHVFWPGRDADRCRLSARKHSLRREHREDGGHTR